MDTLLISKDSLDILGALYSGASLSDSSPDDCLRQLRDNGLIVYRIVGHHDAHRENDPFSVRPVYEIHITEMGKAYYESVLLESEFSEKQLEILRGISDHLEHRVNIAEEEARRAKADSAAATVRSWIAIAISILAVVMQVIGPQLGQLLSVWIK